MVRNILEVQLKIRRVRDIVPAVSPGFLLLVLVFGGLNAQSTGRIEGLVTYADGRLVHHATVMVVQTGHTTHSDHDGRYVLDGLTPGVYDLFAYVASYTSQVRMMRVDSGAAETVDFVLQLSPIRDSVTVTARGRHQTTFESVHSMNSLDTFDLAERMAPSIGEVLDGELGVAKRSFGPGSSRPVIRGFDGDRVLVMSDGMRVGSLGSQSGDHGEPLDPAGLERLEVLRGPATLLYGSNAIGGVVNAVSRHHEMHKHRHEGTRGQITSAAGSNNGLAGAGFMAEHGEGNWMFWAGGGGQRTGDYRSPEGPVDNSKSRIANASAGMGWFGDRRYLSFGYAIRDGRYGIPFADEFHAHHGHGSDEAHDHHDLRHSRAVLDDDDHDDDAEDLEAIDVAWRQHNFRFSGGVQHLDRAVDAVRLQFNLARWRHDELEVLHGGIEAVGTMFENREFGYRLDLDQRNRGRLTGTLGISGLHRNYEATGIEALSPPVRQNGVSFFVLEELKLERVGLQFGARLEHARFSPQGPVERHYGHDEDRDRRSLQDVDHDDSELAFLPDRTFTSASAGAGTRFRLGPATALVANLTSSYRAPALEELYNYGPHVGNLAFEIGNANLKGERSNGIDLSLRHSADRMRGEANFFHYGIANFIFPVPTGDIEDGLVEVEYLQADSRFTGTELRADFSLLPGVWLKLGLDVVDAELRNSGSSLPRIPPLRSRVGMDLLFGGFGLRPELVLASARSDVFETETPTPGYGVVNLRASYTLPRDHFVHSLFFEVFNVGDKLYRNHVSFIKDLAPEMGRGVRFSYAAKFF
jgi:iron complex outermembrane recepter protein